ncbi:MAG: PhzF family phenazine biosynthesis protein [Acidimicrobiales bacterium]
MTGARVPIVWVDAFSDGPFTGNPAAVCLLERPATEKAMQSLAFEIGLSETAFVWPEHDGFGLRWFTPAAEVSICGHATVATAHALAEAGRLRGEQARFSTKSGWLEATLRGDEVEIELPSEDSSAADVPAPLAARWPVVRAATARSDLLVELESERAVRELDPAGVELASLPHRGIAVTARADSSGDVGADYVLRFFAPRVGVPEDPVTGSAQCYLGPYWAAALGSTELRAVQLSPRGGVLRVRTGETRVRVAGRASTVLRGEVVGEAARRLVGEA